MRNRIHVRYGSRIGSALIWLAVHLIVASPALAYVEPTRALPHATGVLRGFDKPEHNWLPGHRGVDLALDIGAPVHAAEEGVVAFTGVVAGTPAVSIDHADGIRTTYQPVYPQVNRGDQISEGQIIGTLAHPFDGHPGLHWGAKKGTEYINPLSLLSTPVIRLKPVGGLGDKPV
ncbi:peptidoglycan DD-metalloendopeptidase family protein [Corynebacterium poyangense]|uniref:Peptidoglycan DD-metalloendopeptidase family protein n=1 Tax=Corynebacterium poyangense TaxID=2684405 RepID=A0A7H0SPJ0_9CORY|nr:M23 family metallopeptidase [Corynebacterium poyangense]QNQ90465.1 peptidoglycan DD-metalloendopeptidase family protein [Corynebacterium poyangense]